MPIVVLKFVFFHKSDVVKSGNDKSNEIESPLDDPTLLITIPEFDPSENVKAPSCKVDDKSLDPIEVLPLSLDK